MFITHSMKSNQRQKQEKNHRLTTTLAKRVFTLLYNSHKSTLLYNSHKSTVIFLFISWYHRIVVEYQWVTHETVVKSFLFFLIMFRPNLRIIPTIVWSYTSPNLSVSVGRPNYSWDYLKVTVIEVFLLNPHLSVAIRYLTLKQ